MVCCDSEGELEERSYRTTNCILPLLPGSHPLVEIIIRASHDHLKHVGTDFLLTYIRQHFWISSRREAVKRFRRNCTICRRIRAKPGEQLMGNLPDSRLDSSSLPFTRTALDYLDL
jgi:hypothetical protein